jgi:hypothetical protein
MSKLFIRVKKDGFIYDYNEIMAANPACEVVTEEVAYPERFIPAHAAEYIAPEPAPAPKATKPRRKAALDLTTADIPEPPPYTPAELAEEVSRGL